MRSITLPFLLLLCVCWTQSCGGNKEKNDPADPEVISVDWNQAASNGVKSLIRHFWNSEKGYFNTEPDKADGPDRNWNYWPQAHAMDILIDAYLRTGDPSFKPYFDAWYEGVKQKSGGGYLNVYYDDMEWICLTMIRLYECTQDRKFLDTAQFLWDDIRTGWNSEGGGGIAWKKDQLWSKNACSNGPAGIIAAKLYKINGKAEDLAWAKKIYLWEADHLYDSATGRIFDHLDARTGSIIDWCFTYNQGTFVGMAHLLWQITGERMYLVNAVKAASFTIGSERCTDVGKRILRDEGLGDGGLFKGIFIRYFVQLMQDENLSNGERNRFETFLDHNARMLWNNGVDQNDPLFGPDWSKSGAATVTELGTQMSGCALLEGRAVIFGRT